MKSFVQLKKQIIGCSRCPRLRMHCATIGQIRRLAFREQTYWAKPVPGFGVKEARFWIVGLAPGAHGANRTGRVFTGDSSGDWLYSALYRVGLSSAPKSINNQDGLILRDTYISCICRCAPPDNRPTPAEISHCSSYLKAEWSLLRYPPLILTLGELSFKEILRLLENHYKIKKAPQWKFKHGALYEIAQTKVLVSYHPSRQNTSTYRLTTKMWDSIFDRAAGELKDHSLRKN